MVKPRSYGLIDPAKVCFSHLMETPQGRKYIQVYLQTEQGSQTICIQSPGLRIVSEPQISKAGTGTVRLIFESSATPKDSVLAEKRRQYIALNEELDRLLTHTAVQRSVRWFGKQLSVAEVKMHQDRAVTEEREKHTNGEETVVKQVHISAKIVEEEPDGRGIKDALRNSGFHGDPDHDYACTLQLAGVYFRNGRFGYSWYLRAADATALPYAVPCAFHRDVNGEIKAEPTGYLYRKEMEAQAARARRQAQDRSFGAASDVESLEAQGYDSRTTSTVQSTFGSSMRSTAADGQSQGQSQRDGPSAVLDGLQSLSETARVRIFTQSTAPRASGEMQQEAVELATSVKSTAEEEEPTLALGGLISASESGYQTCGYSIDSQVAYRMFVASQDGYVSAGETLPMNGSVDELHASDVFIETTASVTGLRATLPSSMTGGAKPNVGIESPIEAVPFESHGSTKLHGGAVGTVVVKVTSGSFASSQTDGSTVSVIESGSGSGAGSGGSQNPQGYRIEDIEDDDDDELSLPFALSSDRAAELRSERPRLGDTEGHGGHRVRFADSGDSNSPRPDASQSLSLDALLEKKQAGSGSSGSAAAALPGNDGVTNCKSEAAHESDEVEALDPTEMAMEYVRFVSKLLGSASETELIDMLRYAKQLDSKGLVSEIVLHLRGNLNRDNALQTALLAVELDLGDLREGCEEYMTRPGKLMAALKSEEFARLVRGPEGDRLLEFASGATEVLSKRLAEAREKATTLDDLVKKYPHLVPKKKKDARNQWQCNVGGFGLDE